MSELENEVQQYLMLKEQMDLLTQRQAEIKKRLLVSVESMGEVNEKGHLILQVGEVKLTRQRKESNPLDEAVADKIITEKGLEDLCKPLVRKFDSQAIMAAVYQDLLTEADIDAMFPIKVSYAFIVN